MKSPTPPNPYSTAAAQQQSENSAAISSSIVNNPNVVTPYGSQSYTISGWEQVPDAKGNLIKTPRYTQTQTLSPDQQKLLNLQTKMGYNMGQTGVEQSSKLRGLLNKQVSTKGWQAWNAGPKVEKLRQDQAPTDRKSIENAMMANYTEDTKGQNAAQDAQMAARGLAPGSAQFGTIDKGRGDERARAVREAYLASGAESRDAQNAYNAVAGQRFDMGGAVADRGNALRGAQSAEALALRNQPINELSALMSGSQVTVPQFSPYQGQGVGAANIGQYIGNNYAQQQQAASNFNSGLFNTFGAGLGMFNFG